MASSSAPKEAEPATPSEAKEDAPDTENVKRIEIKKYQAVALWTWDLHIDTCAICKNNIMEQCIECQASASEESCLPAWGSCGHCFHHHCIARWTKTREVCPLDNSEWNISRFGT